MRAWEAAVALSLSGTLWLLLHRHKQDSASDGDKRQRGPSSSRSKQPRQHKQQQQPDEVPAAAAHSVTSTRHLTASRGPAEDIPQHELKPLQAFLRKLYTWRGWQGGPYHITQAWYAVEAAAVTPAGGGWQQQFTGRQLTDANCDALVSVIDVQFCGGKLLRRLRVKGGCKQNHKATSSRSSSSGAGMDGVSADANLHVLNIAHDAPILHGVRVSAVEDGRPSGDGCGVEAPAVPGTSTAAGERAGQLACSLNSPKPESSGEAIHCGEADAASEEAKNATSAGSRLDRRGSQPELQQGSVHKLRCRVVQNFNDGWLAYFDTEDNAIYINCWRWAKEVSAASPINCEGVVCTSRLQLLMHTLGHELVHAVVFHLFPDIDSSSPAYTANNRHGPIFHLLNKQMFGHSSDALEHVHLLPGKSS